MDHIADLLESDYGLKALALRPLGSFEDINVLAVVEGKEYVVKVLAPTAQAEAIDAQHQGLALLREGGAVPVPEPVRRLDGSAVGYVTLPGGERRLAHVIGFMPGRQITGDANPPADFAADLGRAAGEVVAAVADFSHPGLEVSGVWDLRNAPAVVAAAQRIMDDAEAAVVRQALDSAWQVLGGLAPQLPVQAIHGDITGDNTVVDAAGRLAGVIDFGDLAYGWRAAELAAAMTSLLHHDGDAVALALEAAAAFDSKVTLTEAELAALWPMVTARAAVLVAQAAAAWAEDPHNDYAAARRPLERLMLSRALSLGFDEALALIEHALGRLEVPGEVRVPVLDVTVLGGVRELDLSVTAECFDGGAYLDAQARDAAALRGGVGAVTRWAEHRPAAQLPAASTPATLALGRSVVLPVGTELRVPADAEVLSVAGDTVILSLSYRNGGSELLAVTQVTATAGEGERLAEGEVFARVAAAGGVAGDAGSGMGTLGMVAIQRSRASVMPSPLVAAGHGQQSRLAAWREICPDPAPMLGLAAAPVAEGDPASEASSLLELRREHVAEVQEFYYSQPPRIERGWRHYLMDTRGRPYLDMINNVAILGHGEPRIADAVDKQMRLLNTNSRFHYGAIARFSEQLAQRAPEGLDQVFLVNSGSEAVDLAVRLIRAVTARPGVLALAEAYHGWTLASDAISTSLGDNPGALGSRPDWVHVLDAPNTYRGKHRGVDGHGYLKDALARLEELDAAGVSLAGLIAEPIFGNGGGVLLPKGYMAGLADAVRARGGLVVSDEVQVSYGRLGEHFWGFEQQGFVPDVITVAKAMGNGFPLGAVITTREIAQAFAVEGSFFSSAGGSPVSCVVGSTVLEVLEADGLQENARLMGERLREGLEALSLRYPAVGAVHGMGLYLGVEIVAGGPDQPDKQGAAQVCEALLDYGVIVQPTGDHKNVLKIKPPLTIDAHAVDHFVASLWAVMELREARARV